MEALASAEPVRRFVADFAGDIAFVALSDPYRPQRGGMIGQAVRLLRQSGPRLLPYMTANFSLPRIAGLWVRHAGPPERTPMQALCRSRGIPAETVPDMNDPAFHARLRASGAELILIFHCDQILSAATIGCLKLGAINVHAGLLPDHRGPVPTIHALLESKPRFGITVHRVVPRIDAGPILARKAVYLPPGTSALRAALELHTAAVPLVADVLQALATHREAECAVDPGPYCGFPTPEQLKCLARMRHRTASWRDMIHALRVPV